MKTELTKINGGAAKIAPAALDSFNADILAKEPKNKVINKFANNSLFVPIGEIENTLDNIYRGLWKYDNFKSQVIANEIVGSIELHVFHPVAGIWITRVGSASVIIQTKSGSNAIDPTNKIKNTLVKDYPHLKSECVKNAAKSLGRVFGRDLNRDGNVIGNYDTDTFEGLMTEIDKDEVQTKIDNCTDLDELKTMWEGLPKNQQSSAIIRKMITKAKKSF